MPICLKCGWEIVIGPAGCACTQAARRKRTLEKVAKVGEELSKKLSIAMEKSKEGDMTRAEIQEKRKKLEVRRDELRHQQDLLAADFRALQKKCKHPTVNAAFPKPSSTRMSIGRIKRDVVVTCEDCGYQT